MKKLIIYYNFIVVSFFVISGFLAATTPIQLVIAILFFPLFMYFAARVIPKKSKAIFIPIKEIKIENKESETEEEKEEDKQVIKLKKEGVDINRRMFLKLIGSAGLSIFLFSLFTKRTEAAFFGSAPGGPGVLALKDTAGNKIDPAEKQPTDGYRISDLDDADPSYYGFINKDGSWFIQKETSSGSYRYTKGGSGYSTNWTNRAGLSYDYFENIF
ncbi:hypothetical protein BH10PAT1_BH10PAT1_0970 [soil metagenome]